MGVNVNVMVMTEEIDLANLVLVAESVEGKAYLN